MPQNDFCIDFSLYTLGARYGPFHQNRRLTSTIKPIVSRKKISERTNSNSEPSKAVATWIKRHRNTSKKTS